MSHRINLSTSFNMSLGFVPVVVSIILCEFLDQDFAIYAGTIVGLVFSYFNYYRSSNRIPNYILYTVTAILVVFALISMFSPNKWPHNWLPLTLEVSIIIPLLFIYLYKENFTGYFRNRPESPFKSNYIQAAEATVVSIRVVLLFALAHFAVITICILFFRSLDSLLFWILLIISPFLVFLFAIIFNQLGLNYFNNTVSEVITVPVVNEKGDVISKIIREDIPEQKNNVTVPVIRIAVENQGMLFLAKRTNGTGEHEKMDTPLESLVFFKETIDIAVKRILNFAFPEEEDLEPRFSIRYLFRNEEISRLVYLFILHIDDDSLLTERRFPAGKLWTLQQIDQNIDKGFFSDYLEYEYEHLKMIISIREKYKRT